LAVIATLTAAIAPGAALLVYFYLKDRYHSEPIGMVLKIFLLGLLIVFPVMVLQRGMIPGMGENEYAFAFIVSAGLEEFVKWFVVYHYIYKHAIFDEPYDGIVYAVAVSLGFATLENVIYSLLHDLSISALILRALLPVPGHALFGVIMGYYLGKAKFSTRQIRYLVLSLLFPIGWHGLYDLIQLKSNNWMTLSIPFMILLWAIGMRKVTKANARSPFRMIGNGH
jgi:RsiW-degrading membrane proteinase PrsW (M82 family)